LIAVGFSILVLLSWKLSLNRKRVAYQTANYDEQWDGTVCANDDIDKLDGFRADFLNRGITPRLNAFIAEGVSPVYMLPSFPSVTFPNSSYYFTGLYPESMAWWEYFFGTKNCRRNSSYTHPNSMDPKWVGRRANMGDGGEQGIRSAIHMWPGSEAHIMVLNLRSLTVTTAKNLCRTKYTYPRT